MREEAEARRSILERTPLGHTVVLPLREALGRVLARDAIATVPLPGFDNSQMDGYAVRAAEAPAGAELRVTGEQPAGVDRTLSMGPREAIRIFTGAPMPEGADTVFMQEDVRAEDGRVIVPPGLKLGSNRRLAGEDIAAGSIALPAGRVLSIADLALGSALGLTALSVRRRIRVALFSTGDELTEPGRPLGRAQLYDANRALLAGLIEALGASITDLGILPDDPAKLAPALKAAVRALPRQNAAAAARS